MVASLSPSLRSLVKTVQLVLGDTVRDAEGPRVFASVEAVRLLMVRVRAGDARSLREAASALRALSPARRACVARAYTLYMELVNACENAHRTHRLRARRRNAGAAALRPASPRPGANVVFVLTSHPTEARSPANVRLLHGVQKLLVEALEFGQPPRMNTLRHLLRQMWIEGTHPGEKPSVRDEARYIYSLLGDQVFDEMLALYREGHRVRVRSWVGGDKDGHPGVGAEQTRMSLGASRERILSFITKRLEGDLFSFLAMARDPVLDARWREFSAAKRALRRVLSGDGARVRRFQTALHRLRACYRRLRGVDHQAFTRLEHLLDLYPGLVIPLELREERGLFGKSSPIAAMLRAVKALARGGEVSWYARGMVVSMTSSAVDLEEAAVLVETVFGGPAVAAVPLFEMPDDLPRAPKILDAAVRRGAFGRVVRARGRRLEVMLGYSDTAKRMGSFPSRLEIRDAMEAIGRWSRARGVSIVYFHGAGGSEGRGGGTIEEQAATWPKDALGTLKITVQGEMVERLFSTREILRSQVEKIAAVQAKPPSRKRVGAFARALAAEARAAYEKLVADPGLYALVSAATPYTRLGTLTIGSRPAKRSRSGPSGLETLRAIPWVLCWTQTRLLLPVWYGLGSGWRRELKKPGAARRLAKARTEDPLLRGFLRQLGFALAKTAPAVWEKYARRLAPKEASGLLKKLDRERRSALALAKAAGGGLLKDRDWLRESIRLRAPMIHPLNLLQIELLASGKDDAAARELFRETVTGVSAGMLTTG